MKTYHIAFGHGAKGIKLNFKDFTFREFADSCSKAKKGSKHEYWFLRGGDILETEDHIATNGKHWGKGFFRSDRYLLSADFLVIDGDCSVDNTSAPAPKSAHEALTHLNINHFIYTTHSHNPPDKNKFRVVIPCFMANKEQLIPTNKKIMTELYRLNVLIKLVDEMNRWSQYWFLPTRDDPEDGKFEFYSYFDGDDYKAVDNFKNEQTDRKTEESNSRSWAEHYEAFMATGEGHIHYTPMCQSLANKGFSVEKIIEYMTPICRQAFKLHGRNWDDDKVDREQNLREAAESAVSKVEFEREQKENKTEIPNINEYTPLEKEIDYPPGLMGELCCEIGEMAPHQNQTISIMTGICAIAGIIGRTYNVSGTGLNIYAAFLADTGYGKDIITDAISKIIGDSNSLFHKKDTFIGPKKYTSAKALVNSLIEGMSKVCVFTESGIMMESQSGDPSSVTRTLLGLYTKSGKNSYVAGEYYSNPNDCIPSLYAPALTVIQESTPNSFIAGMMKKGADISGELPRMWINRVIGDKKYINRNRRTEFSKHIRERIEELILICSANQDEKKVKICNDLEIKPYMWDDNDALVNLENKYRKEGKHLQQIMCSRAWIKTIKISGICSVFNNLKLLEVNDECYRWTQKTIEHEIKTISDAYTHDSSSDLLSVIKNIVGPRIIDILNNRFEIERKSVPTRCREAGIFTRGSLHQVLLNNRVLQEMNDDTTKQKITTGLDKVLEYMVKVGYLYTIDAKRMKELGTRSPIGYRISDDFRVLMSYE